MFGIFLVIPDYSESIDSIPEKHMLKTEVANMMFLTIENHENPSKIWQSHEILIVIFYDTIKIQQSLWSIFGK